MLLLIALFNTPKTQLRTKPLNQSLASLFHKVAHISCFVWIILFKIATVYKLNKFIKLYIKTKLLSKIYFCIVANVKAAAKPFYRGIATYK